MSNDKPNIERPQPASETRVPTEGIEQRSAGQVAAQAAEIIGGGAGATLGGLVAKDLYDQAKDKLALGAKGPSSEREE